jgi:hypothetical protein
VASSAEFWRASDPVPSIEGEVSVLGELSELWSAIEVSAVDASKLARLSAA